MVRTSDLETPSEMSSKSTWSFCCSSLWHISVLHCLSAANKFPPPLQRVSPIPVLLQVSVRSNVADFSAIKAALLYLLTAVSPLREAGSKHYRQIKEQCCFKKTQNPEKNVFSSERHRWFGRNKVARMAQCWEHSPPANVARVRILASTPNVGWVCRWFSPLLREVFLRVIRFSPLLKSQYFQVPIRSGTYEQVSTSFYELLSESWVNILQFPKHLQYKDSLPLPLPWP